MKAGSSYERRLRSLRADLPRLRQRLAMLDEQLAFVQGVADDARTRALVAATPLADRERQAAEDDLRRARVQRDEAAGRVEATLAEQDRLLERMLERRQHAMRDRRPGPMRSSR